MNRFDFNTLGDTIKYYENMNKKEFLPYLPIIARMDGRAFHSFTRGLEKPFSKELIECFHETVKHLLLETNACIGYHQSDEITLIWNQSNISQELWFNAKHEKLVSNLASQTTLKFYMMVQKLIPSKSHLMPTFDARVFQVPSKEDACNVLWWREVDATKNAISMAAHAVFSNKQLHKKNSNEKLDMLHEAGINFNEYPASFKRGTYFKRKLKLCGFTEEERIKLPENHFGKDPAYVFHRHVIEELDLPIFSKISNKVDVVFGDADPIEYGDGV